MGTEFLNSFPEYAENLPLFHIPYSMFHVPYSIFHIQFSIFHVQHSTFHIPHSMFQVPHFIFQIPYSIFHIPSHQPAETPDLHKLCMMMEGKLHPMSCRGPFYLFQVGLCSTDDKEQNNYGQHLRKLHIFWARGALIGKLKLHLKKGKVLFSSNVSTLFWMGTAE